MTPGSVNHGKGLLACRCVIEFQLFVLRCVEGVGKRETQQDTVCTNSRRREKGMTSVVYYNGIGTPLCVLD